MYPPFLIQLSTLPRLYFQDIHTLFQSPSFRIVDGVSSCGSVSRHFFQHPVLSCWYSAEPPFAAQRIDVDGAAYRPHGQKLVGRAFNREWNDVGDTASAAAAGNRFLSGMVRATNDPWSCAVTAPMARNLK